MESWAADQLSEVKNIGILLFGGLEKGLCDVLGGGGEIGAIRSVPPHFAPNVAAS